MKEAFDNFNHVICPGVETVLKDINTQQSRSNGNKKLHLCTGQSLPVVDVILFDMFLTGAVMRNKIPGILYYYFNSPPAILLRWFLMLNDKTPVVALEDHDYFHRIPDEVGQPVVGQMAGILELFLPIGQFLPDVDGIVCNSFRAIDQEDLDLFLQDPRMKDSKAAIYCLGPFIPEVKCTGQTEVEKWLGDKDKRSVIYVSFGSATVPQPEQINEIGKALLMVDQPCIWSLKAGHEQHVPPELISNEAKAKFLIVPWAPQKEILASPATSVMLSHCGWNGTLESLSCGVPLVCFPMFADQLDIGKMLARKGLGQFIPGTGLKPERVVPAEEITAALKQVGEFRHGDQGKFHQAAARMENEIKLALSDQGTSTKEFHRFIQFKEA
ncbi:uncharacterized protein LOC129587675 [Paramacrobiotus metropolitanus]|uniref:uncharacterized protein LOC129587675 n=1 Tax=Paramacrobiotus metropolitanus TaxID=2943436 RepID=UPI0024456847|nr:uncharacterized protein LOC129587675 [Paramacrobiotus metropolitanus]